MGTGEDEAEPTQVALDERKLFPGQRRRDGRQGGDPQHDSKEEGDDPCDENGSGDPYFILKIKEGPRYLL